MQKTTIEHHGTAKRLLPLAFAPCSAPNEDAHRFRSRIKSQHVLPVLPKSTLATKRQKISNIWSTSQLKNKI